MMYTLRIQVVCLTVLVGLSIGCGNGFERDNPFDPESSLGDQFLGSWNRIEAQANEMYVFSVDQSVELWQFTSRTGEAVDRNGSAEETRVRIYAGTFMLVGNQLTMHFTRASSNVPGDSVSAPAVPVHATVSIARNTLILTGNSGKTYYTRHL